MDSSCTEPPLFILYTINSYYFILDYSPLPILHPQTPEDNRAEQGPQRLHEVIRATIARYAPMVWALLQAEAYSARRLTVVQLVATLRAACHDKIARLAAGTDMIQKLMNLQHLTGSMSVLDAKRAILSRHAARSVATNVWTDWTCASALWRMEGKQYMQISVGLNAYPLEQAAKKE